MTSDGNNMEDIYYLWHLERVNVIHKVGDEFKPRRAEAWKTDSPSVKVAIIDNGCTDDHPNLGADRIDDDAMDFAYHPRGAVFEPPEERQGEGGREDADPRELSEDAENLNAFHFDGLPEAFLAAASIANRNQNGLGFDDLVQSEFSSNFAKELIDLVKKKTGPHKFKEAYDPTILFSAHGTACAGIVAGAPVSRKDNNTPPPNDFAAVRRQRERKRAIHYVGVDPQAVILPINTPYNHEIRPVTMALLYACCKKAEVILMPRAVNPLPGNGDNSDPENPVPRATRYDDDPRATRFDDDPQLKKDMKDFETVLSIVSAAIPVVVAAGNEGSKRLQYPASLVGQVDTQHLIVVGAHNSRGARSSYSSGGVGVTLYAASDDAEVIRRDLVRYDTTSWEGRNLDYEGHFGGVEPDNYYSPFGVLTIDIPGGPGYRRGGNDNSENPTNADNAPPRERASSYTVFGGTSAASSIVAGVVSLMQKAKKIGARNNEERHSGIEIKRMLLDHDNRVRVPRGDGVPDTIEEIETVDFAKAYDAAKA